jgi:hypothetical protein
MVSPGRCTSEELPEWLNDPQQGKNSRQRRVPERGGARSSTLRCAERPGRRGGMVRRFASGRGPHRVRGLP